MFNASSKLALALTVIVGIAASASAQSIVGTPMAGSAGAGNSAINGIPLGPANPGVRSDPSGVHQRPDGTALSVTSTTHAGYAVCGRPQYRYWQKRCSEEIVAQHASC
jgi:hypothetical protein